MTYRELFLCDDCDDREPCGYHEELAASMCEPDYDAQREWK